MSGIDEQFEVNEEETAVPERKDGMLTEEEAVAEALIFAAGEPVKLESIAIAIKSDKRRAAKIMDKLISEYEARNGGIIIRKLDKSYVFCSKPSLHEEIRDFFEKPSQTGLSRAAMETLSIVAYNQPVTRAGIEFIRGVNSDGVLVRLIERGLVEECGRSENPGRPILYGTTVKFLQAMGVESLSQLPALEKINGEQKKAEQVAEENSEEEAPVADDRDNEEI
jgi:segregation and condensation protein B